MWGKALGCGRRSGTYEKNRIEAGSGECGSRTGSGVRRDKVRTRGAREKDRRQTEMDRVSRAELKGGQFLEFGDRVGGRENVRSAVGGSGSYCGVGEINHSGIEALVVLVEGRNVDFMLLEVSFEIGPDRGRKVCDVCEDGAVRVLLNLALDFKLFGQLINLALERQRLIRFLLDRLHLLLRRFHSILDLLYTVVEASDVPPSFC